tara:strand:+ start:305 stop:715 length:411 start_codon:yes stop_codon:yes gene_type:complete
MTNQQKPLNVYHRWTTYEENMLVNQLVYNKKSLYELANIHQRSVQSIIQKIPKVINKIIELCTESFSINNKETQTENNTPLNLENESNTWNNTEKNELFDEYIIFLRKTARKHRRSTQSINEMLGDPPNLMSLILT